MREIGRQALALGLLLATLGTPVARLVIDAETPVRRTHVEASHEADHCGVAHAHLACVQIFVSAASASTPDVAVPATAPTPARAAADAGRIAFGPPLLDGRPRAPPPVHA